MRYHFEGKGREGLSDWRRVVTIETDFLPILGMVSRCANPDMAMLNWIAFIKSLNPEVCHISGKNNAMDNILSRACYEGNEDMVVEDEEVNVDFFESARLSAKKQGPPALHRFNENYYEGEWLLIRRFLSTMAPDASWAMEDL